mgnify:CR=1 FL=1
MQKLKWIEPKRFHSKWKIDFTISSDEKNLYFKDKKNGWLPFGTILNIKSHLETVDGISARVYYVKVKGVHTTIMLIARD